MGIRGMYLWLAAVVAVSGCATQLATPAGQSGAKLRLLAGGEVQSLADEPTAEMPSRPVEPEGEFVSVGDASVVSHQQPPTASEPDLPVPAPPVLNSVKPLLNSVKFVAQVTPEPPVLDPIEEVVTPPPTREQRFKDEPVDNQFDRMDRTIADVPVDIRPTSGVLPENIGAEKFGAEPTIDETFPSGEPADVFCSYTPWTICYRPLYFEDIGLERYGKNVGCLQTGLSGVRFFGSIAALPYKMTRRPPRSCECSNGFSRPGDCPLPGYGNRRFEWDAALVEAAVVTGFVYFIP